MGKKLNLILNINKNDISYNSLSDKMIIIIKNNQLIFGIDLDTIYSSIVVMIDENIIMIRNSLGSIKISNKKLI